MLIGRILEFYQWYRESAMSLITSSIFRNTRLRNFTLRHCSNAVQVNNDSKDDLPVEMESPFKKEKAQCILCKMKITPNYKNFKLLSQFVSPFTGRVYGSHVTGLCRMRQAQVEKEIDKARNAGFMPYYFKDPVFTKDPKIFDVEKPFRTHKY